MQPEQPPLQRRFMDAQMQGLIVQLAVMENTMKTLSGDVQEISRTSLHIAAGRPSWAVTTLLTILTSSVAGLSVEVIHLLTRK